MRVRKSLIFIELNSDQRRETVNTQQRFLAWEDGQRRRSAVRGSMVWKTVDGHDYLARSFYDKLGIRRQKSLGPRSAETERIKAEQAAIAAKLVSDYFPHLPYDAGELKMLPRDVFLAAAPLFASA